MPLSDANITIAELQTCTLDLTQTDNSSLVEMAVLIVSI